MNHKPWILVGLAIVATAAVLVIDAMVDSQELGAGINTFAVFNAKALGAAGCLVAMYCFARQDYLHKAWLAAFLSTLLLLETELAIYFISPHLDRTGAELTRSLFQLAANSLMPVSIVLFARAVRVAGLEVVGSPTHRVIAALVGTAVALAIAGPALLSDFGATVHGDWLALGRLSSDASDIICFILIAPLAYAVFTLRGGVLFWPFMLIAVSQLVWLAYDIALAMLSMDGASLLWATVARAGQLLGCLLLFAAGLAQHWALTSESPRAAFARSRAEAA